MMVLGLLDGHPFLSSPVMFCITREQRPGGCTPQPPMSVCHLGLVGGRHCHQIRGLGEGEAGGFFALCRGDISVLSPARETCWSDNFLHGSGLWHHYLSSVSFIVSCFGQSLGCLGVSYLAF